VLQSEDASSERDELLPISEEPVLLPTLGDASVGLALNMPDVQAPTDAEGAVPLPAVVLQQELWLHPRRAHGADERNRIAHRPRRELWLELLSEPRDAPRAVGEGDDIGANAGLLVCLGTAGDQRPQQAHHHNDATQHHPPSFDTRNT